MEQVNKTETYDDYVSKHFYIIRREHVLVLSCSFLPLLGGQNGIYNYLPYCPTHSLFPQQTPELSGSSLVTTTKHSFWKVGPLSNLLHWIVVNL